MSFSLKITVDDNFYRTKIRLTDKGYFLAEIAEIARICDCSNRLFAIF